MRKRLRLCYQSSHALILQLSKVTLAYWPVVKILVVHCLKAWQTWHCSKSCYRNAHHTSAASQHRQVREFYTQPLFDELPQHIRFISAAYSPTGAPINIDSDSIALSIADTFCSTLNFTALIQSARQQGARLFVEVGADRQTSTLIDKINCSDNVADQNCTIASNAKGGDDVVTLIKCIGQINIKSHCLSNHFFKG